MSKVTALLVASLVAAVPCLAGETSGPPAATPDPAPRAEAVLADMLARMREALQSVAQAYGDPSFAEVFTNDPAEAERLRLRLRLGESVDRLRAELKDLETKRDALLDAIALRQRDLALLAGQVARERGSRPADPEASGSAPVDQEGPP